MESVPVPTCCKLHANNYTCIPQSLGRRVTLDPYDQLVNFVAHMEISLARLKILPVNLEILSVHLKILCPHP